MAWSDERATDAAVTMAGVFVASLGPTVQPPAQEMRATPQDVDARFVSLVAAGAEYAMAWREGAVGQQRIHFAVVGADGTPATGTAVSQSGDLEAPAVAWTGSEYGVVWEDQRAANSDLYFQRVASDGQPTGGEVQLTSGLYDERNPTIAFHADGYAVAWEDSRNGPLSVYLRRFDAAGAPLGSEVEIASAGWQPSLTASSSGFGIAWSDVGSTQHVRFALLDASGAMSGLPVDLWDDGAAPSVVWAGDGFGVAFHGWAPGASGSAQIQFRELDAQGQPRAPHLQATQSAGASFAASVAFDGSEYVVAYVGPPVAPNADIYAVRVRCE